MDDDARPGRLRRRVRLGLFVLAGTAVGLLLGGSVRADLGPFDTTASVRPDVSGRTIVRLAPLGTIELDTHDAPVALEVRVDELRIEEAERVARDPAILDGLEDALAADSRRVLLRLLVQCLVVGAAGGAVGALVASSTLRSGVVGALGGAVVVLAGSVGVAGTFDARAVAEPRYSGLLTVAPTAVGDVEAIVDRFGAYRAQLSDLVGNVVSLYRTAQGLPTFDPEERTTRVLHVSDIHLNPQAFDLIDLLVREFEVDAVADTGDLTDWGTEPETRIVERIRAVPVPYVWVRGNHDSEQTAAAVAAQPNAVVLDGQAVTVAGLRFWGAADRRYTPEKDKPTGKDVERDQADAAAPALARLLDRSEPPAVDVAMVHDPRMAARLAGKVPLVLAGHTHAARSADLGDGLLLVEGSTGGAGLRGLEGAEPEPLAATILYFDRVSDRLVAFDRVTVRGLGKAGARIVRHVIEPRGSRSSATP